MIEDSSMADRTNGRWNKEEHQKFILGLKLYGKNWKKIEELIVTRNGSQIRSHAQKYFMKCMNKSGELNEDIQNVCPRYVEDGKDKELTIKGMVKKQKTLRLNSPNFWQQMSQLVKTPGFTFWQMIEQNTLQQTHEHADQSAITIATGPKDKSFVPCSANKRIALRQHQSTDNLISQPRF